VTLKIFLNLVFLLANISFTYRILYHLLNKNFTLNFINSIKVSNIYKFYSE